MLLAGLCQWQSGTGHSASNSGQEWLQCWFELLSLIFDVDLVKQTYSGVCVLVKKRRLNQMSKQPKQGSRSQHSSQHASRITKADHKMAEMKTSYQWVSASSYSHTVNIKQKSLFSGRTLWHKHWPATPLSGAEHWAQLLCCLSALSPHPLSTKPISFTTTPPFVSSSFLCSSTILLL